MSKFNSVILHRRKTESGLVLSCESSGDIPPPFTQRSECCFCDTVPKNDLNWLGLVSICVCTSFRIHQTP